MDDLDSLFETDGALPVPTMRGSANLDVQDYANASGDSFLDDELQEDTPSTPGSGAGPAPDVEGTSRYGMLEEPDSPDAAQTTYGAGPWGPGSGTGYRPMSMAQTDLSGNEDNARAAAAPRRQPPSRRQPSNADIDPRTIYDRDSYENDDSSQSTIGNGIFEMEEGVTFRARDGSFSHQYAQPAYLTDEDELGVEQSEMYDVVADNWRVVQPSGGGVTFARRVDALRPRGGAYSPYATAEASPAPISKIERFSRDAARAVVREAAGKSGPGERSQFLTNALESLGRGTASRCHDVTRRMVGAGAKPQDALEEVIALCVMNATVQDLSGKRSGAQLPRVDSMAAHVQKNKGALQQSAGKNLVPLAKDTRKLKGEVVKLYQSPVAVGMGEVASEQGDAAATTAAPTAIQPVAIQNHTMRNIVIGALVIGGGYYALTKTGTGQEIVANVGSALGMKRARRRRKARA